MKTNKLVALLTVCGLFAGSTSVMVAHNHNHGGSCRSCNDNKCQTCPREHTNYCEAKPTCEKVVCSTVTHAPCKNCSTTCSYTCPVGYEKAGVAQEEMSDVKVAAQDGDWVDQTEGKTYSNENGSKPYKKGKKMVS